ncbi:MAG TPA: sterol desaturase family protein [Deltaproteobacteria bacterium]|nr:sterol desaturase family protein [Deltaproteobacteria bacterium]
MVLELLLADRTHRRIDYETRDTLASLIMGAGSVVEGAVLGSVAYVVLVAAHQLALLDLGWSVPTFALCFVLDDLRYYVYHRVSHESRWFWAAHVSHHSSQHYNLSTALRQTWTSTLAGSFLFWIPLAILGFHPVMIVFVSSINLVYQFWIHTEAIGRLPAPIEAVFNTPSHHRVHHARNPRYLDANHAGTLIIWDRLFGTFVPEDTSEPCRYGLVKDLGTFNPIRIALHEWVAIARDVIQRELSLGQRLRYAFGAPGWSHDGSRRTSAEIKADWVRDHPETAGLPGLPEPPEPPEPPELGR